MTTSEIGPLMIVVSRQEVENQDTSGPLSTLKRLISSPEVIRKFRTRVDISFDGYSDTSEELFEIPDVRNYVHALDAEFPFWLYFLSREHLGLQCLTLCFLLPYLTDARKAGTHPKQLGDLLEKRWGPALNHICAAAGLPDTEADALLESALLYFRSGPVQPVQ